jgi:hypothetical protein
MATAYDDVIPATDAGTALVRATGTAPTNLPT